jgi:hypothetical protein
VITFDLDGKRLSNVKPKPPGKLEGASGLVVVNQKLYVLNSGSSEIIAIDLR